MLGSFGDAAIDEVLGSDNPKIRGVFSPGGEATKHFQLAQVQTKLDQAEFHMKRLTDTLDCHVRSGQAWEIPTRARCRADVAEALKLSREVCEIVEQGSGANSIYTRGSPLPRIVPDIRAISVHSFLPHSTNAELYGRVLAGPEPEVPFI